MKTNIYIITCVYNVPMDGHDKKCFVVTGDNEQSAIKEGQKLLDGEMYLYAPAYSYKITAKLVFTNVIIPE